MHRFPAAAAAIGLGFAFAFALAFAACSNDDAQTAPGEILPPSPSTPSKFEAGAPCLTANDCAAGFVCLFPASAGCGSPRVCAPAPPATCDQPATVCTCLGETVSSCDGYADDAIASTGACEGGEVVGSPDSGTDDGAVDASPDALEAGAMNADAGATDASDAAATGTPDAEPDADATAPEDATPPADAATE